MHFWANFFNKINRGYSMVSYRRYQSVNLNCYTSNVVNRFRLHLYPLNPPSYMFRQIVSHPWSSLIMEKVVASTPTISQLEKWIYWVWNVLETWPQICMYDNNILMREKEREHVYICVCTIELPFKQQLLRSFIVE